MISINGDRLWERLHIICNKDITAKIENMGVTRQSFTKEYREGADMLIRWMKEAGLKTRMDAAGNIYGKLEGEIASPCLLIGSHLDTVPNGGRFDGLAGVMAALEVLTCMHENSIRPKYAVEMVALANEEACQYKGGIMGGKAIAGILPLDHPVKTFDNEGNCLRDAMLQFGADPDHLAAAKRNKNELLAFLELHIEQAPLLEEMGYPVGIVSAISGIHQMVIKIEGISAHAGAMPMSKRKDTLAAAAHIACEVERLANNSGSATRGTVGYIKALPGEHNIIPGSTEVPVDLREADVKIRQRIFNDLIEFTDNICKIRGLKWENKVTLDAHPVESDPRIAGVHKRSAKALGVPHMDIISYAAHDSLVLAELCPVGMIFVRSIGGLSHRPEEYTTKEDLEAGTGILLGSVLEISKNGLI